MPAKTRANMLPGFPMAITEMVIVLNTNFNRRILYVR